MKQNLPKFVIALIYLSLAGASLPAESLAASRQCSEIFKSGEIQTSKTDILATLDSDFSFTNEQKVRLRALYKNDNFRNLIAFLKDSLEGLTRGDKFDSLFDDFSKQDYQNRAARIKDLGSYRRSVLILELQLLSHVMSADSIPPFVKHTFFEMLDVIGSRQFTKMRFEQLEAALKAMVQNIEVQKTDLNSYLNVQSNLDPVMQLSKDLLAENNAILPPHSITNIKQPGYIYDYYDFQPNYFNH